MKKPVSKYPRFNVVDEDPVSDLESQKFVDLIRAALKNFPYFDEKWINESQRKFFMRMKEVGYDQAAAFIGKKYKLTRPLTTTLNTFDFIGKYIIEGTEFREQIKKLIPWCLFTVSPNRDAIDITVKHFRKAILASSSVWAPASARFIFWNGQKLTLTYSNHAIERMQERILTELSPYREMDALGNLFFSQAVLPVYLSENNSPMAEFYLALNRRDGEFDYLNQIQIFEEKMDEDAYYNSISPRFYCRVGYGPFEIVGTHAVVKTILLPGYGGTPEKKLINEIYEHSKERPAFLKAIGEPLFSRPKSLDQIALLEFLRTNGLPAIFSEKALLARSQQNNPVPINTRFS